MEVIPSSIANLKPAWATRDQEGGREGGIEEGRRRKGRKEGKGKEKGREEKQGREEEAGHSQFPFVSVFLCLNH